MNRVTHFEIFADDTERALRFYTTVFGWEFKKWEQIGGQDYWLITTGKDEPGTMWPGINGGLIKRDKPLSGEGYRAFVCTMDVTNIDEMMEKVKAGGGTLETPKMEIPGIGWLCYCFDTEGNRFGMMQAAAPGSEPKM